MDLQSLLSALFGGNNDVSDLDKLYQAKGIKLSKLGKVAYNLIKAGKLQHDALESAYKEILDVDKLITQTSILLAEVDMEQDFLFEIQDEPTADAPKKRGRKPKVKDAIPAEKPKRGRKPMVKKETAEPKKRGRKKAVVADASATPKRRGRKPKQQPVEVTDALPEGE